MNTAFRPVQFGLITYKDLQEGKALVARRKDHYIVPHFFRPEAINGTPTESVSLYADVFRPDGSEVIEARPMTIRFHNGESDEYDVAPADWKPWKDRSVTEKANYYVAKLVDVVQRTLPFLPKF